MDVPAEVLTTSMRAHQKYFSLLNADGSLAPRFGFVANMASGGRRQGDHRRERARAARPSVGRQVLLGSGPQQPLADRAPALDAIVFHAKLGTVAERSSGLPRWQRISATDIPGADRIPRAVPHCCARRISSPAWSREFPDLQGVMGRYYALGDG